jgi:type I restriction enzyme R subunit
MCADAADLANLLDGG